MDITSNQSCYRFPLLKNAEIIECLSDAGIELTESELTEPHRHKDKVKAVFYSLLEIALGMTEESFTQTSISEMKHRQSLPYPELHDESFSNLKFFRALQKLFHICGLNGHGHNNHNSDGYGFGLIDLGAPTKVRFKRQLSAAINFIKYREDSLVTYYDLASQREELLKGLQEAQDERTNLSNMLQQAKDEARHRWDEANIINDDCAELEGEIAQQNKLQRTLRGESEELKKMANRLKDQIAAVDMALQEKDVEERKLLPQVVDSPDELKMQIAEMGVELEQEHKRLDEAMNELKVAELRVRNVEKAKNDVLAATRLAEELIMEKEKFNGVQEEVEEGNKAIDANQREIESLKNIRSGHEADLLQIEAATEENRKQHKIKMEEVQNALQTANAQLLAVEKDERHAKETLEQHEEDIKVLKTVIDEEQNKAQEEIQDIISSFGNVEKVVVERLEEFNSCIRVV